MENVRPRRTFIRKSGYRDALLIVIACEGTATEPAYFEAVKQKLLSWPSRVHVEILKRGSTRSAPEYVVSTLDGFRRDYHLKKDDELWIVIDFDRWGEKKLSEQLSLVFQKGYHAAVSRPCFELWLLLHLVKPSDLSQDDMDVLQERGCDVAKNLIRRFAGSYSKSLSDVDLYIGNVKQAIAGAKELDIYPDDRWPNTIGTRVYKLMESILSNS